MDWLKSVISSSLLAPLMTAGCSMGRGVCESLCPLSLGLCCERCSYCDAAQATGVYVVTGGNRSLGYNTAKILLQQGHTVHILSRCGRSGTDAATELMMITGNQKCTAFQVDLSDMRSVENYVLAMAQQRTPINGLINNAGTIGSNSMRVNHVGHAALTLGN